MPRVASGRWLGPGESGRPTPAGGVSIGKSDYRTVADDDARLHRRWCQHWANGALSDEPAAAAAAAAGRVKGRGRAGLGEREGVETAAREWERGASLGGVRHSDGWGFFVTSERSTLRSGRCIQSVRGPWKFRDDGVLPQPRSHDLGFAWQKNCSRAGRDEHRPDWYGSDGRRGRRGLHRSSAAPSGGG